jgi:hypothetical protein
MGSVFGDVFEYVAFPGAAPEIVEICPNDYDAPTEEDTIERRLHEGDAFGYGIDWIPEGVDVSGIDPADLPF